MDCMYKGMGGRERSGGGGWDAGGSLYLPIGLFAVAMSPRTTSHRPRQAWRALRVSSLTQGWISDPYLSSSALHGPHCLSHDFTWSAKPAPEKQTSQLSPSMQQCNKMQLVECDIMVGFCKSSRNVCARVYKSTALKDTSQDKYSTRWSQMLYLTLDTSLVLCFPYTLAAVL